MFLSLMLLLPFLPFLIPVEAEPGTGTCAPVTWTNEVKPGETRPPPPPSRRFQLTDRKGNVPLPGEVNCRYSGWSGSQVDASTCAQLATKYKVGLDKFFELNRSRVSAGCGDIKPQTEYCMAGFIQPLVSKDGRCGPKFNNATCIGTEHQCCNSETWTCGSDLSTDCAPGTCYEGACYGHKIYTTDGTCGRQNDHRLCLGKWGDCCDQQGRCGFGMQFCAYDACQSGKCLTREPTEWIRASDGNSTDGTCGGERRSTCSVVWGQCCNKNGKCGTGYDDCFANCQPEYGKCNQQVAWPLVPFKGPARKPRMGCASKTFKTFKDICPAQQPFGPPPCRVLTDKWAVPDDPPDRAICRERKRPAGR